MSAAPIAGRPGRARPAAGLALGSVLTGVLAFVFFATCTRALGSAAAAPVAVLWSWWGFAAAALTFPVQHWIARTVAEDATESGVRATAGRLGGPGAAVVLVSLTAALLAREPLFGGDVALAVLVPLVSSGALWMGLVRGLLSARGRYGAVAGALVAENLVRCVVAALLLVAGVESPAAYGLALAAGYLACLAWPSAWWPRSDRTDDEPRAPGGVASFLASTSGGQVLGQVVLTGGPVALALLGGAPAAVTALFAGLALYRAPFTVLQGQVAPLTGRLTRLVVEGRVARLRELERRIVVLSLLGAALAVPVGAWVGPWAVRVVFGDGVVLDRDVSVLLAPASVLALATLVLGVLLLAHGRPQRTLAAWVAGLVLALLVLAAGPTGSAGSAVTVAWAFLAAEAAAWSCLVVAARGARRGLVSPP